MRKVSRRERRKRGKRGRGRRGGGADIGNRFSRDLVWRDSGPRVNTDASLRSRTFIRYIDRLIYRHDPVISLFSPANHPSRESRSGARNRSPLKRWKFLLASGAFPSALILLFPSSPIIDAPRSPSCEKFRGKKHFAACVRKRIKKKKKQIRIIREN